MFCLQLLSHNGAQVIADFRGGELQLLGELDESLELIALCPFREPERLCGGVEESTPRGEAESHADTCTDEESELLVRCQLPDPARLMQVVLAQAMPGRGHSVSLALHGHKVSLVFKHEGDVEPVACSKFYQ